MNNSRFMAEMARADRQRNAEDRWRLKKHLADLKRRHGRTKSGQVRRFNRPTDRATRGQGSWTKAGRTPALLLKLHKGGRAGDGYAASQTGAELLCTNMLGQTPAQRWREFSLDLKRHPMVSESNMFCHLSLSRPVSQPLTLAQWCAAVELFLEGLGARGCQFVATRHTSTENDHVHVIFSRARSDGALVAMANNFYRWRTVVREVERSLNLDDDPHSDLNKEFPLTDRIVVAQRRASRLGTTDPWIPAECIRGALADAGSSDIFVQNLAGIGIETKPATRTSDGAVVGILFRHIGSVDWLAGSSIDRSLSLARIRQTIEENEMLLATQRQRGEHERRSRSRQRTLTNTSSISRVRDR